MFLEDHSAFEFFYIETVNSENEDLIFRMFDRKQLAEILSKDVTCIW